MTLLALTEARRHVLERVPSLAPVEVALADALGLVAAEAVTSVGAVPPFANAAVDGYAVQAASVASATNDVPSILAVVGTVAAGAVPDVAVGPGTAVRIMTGAPLPGGTDAVVMVEDTSADGDHVAIRAAVSVGAGVRAAGTDLQEGDVVVAAGTALGPAHVALLATAGRSQLRAVPRVRVGVLSTGDELVAPGTPLRPGQIYDSNRLGLLGQLHTSGFEPVDLGWVADDPDAIETVLCMGASTCDAVVTSGGVSMGDYDHVKAVLDKIGDMRWMQIAIKPAKPFAFGLVDGTPVFGLPGNPVSSMVSFELLARPALRAMAGHAELDRPRIEAIADEDLPRRADGKTHFVRVAARWHDDGRLHVRSAGQQGSHQLSALAAADALAVLIDGPGVRAGDPVPCLVFDP